MKKSKKSEYTIWNKFYECDCHGEGIMISYEGVDQKDHFRYVDLAYWKEGVYTRQLRLKDRIRIAWKLLITGNLYNDMVMLKAETAKELGQDLLNFAKKGTRPEKARKITERLKRKST